MKLGKMLETPKIESEDDEAQIMKKILEAE